MKYRLLCIDIDGTLLDDEKRIPRQVKESLKKEVLMGAQIALISGRMPAGVDMIEKELGIECIKACNAGTYILMGERCISAEYLTTDIMREIYRKISLKKNIPLWIFREKEWFMTGSNRYVEREMKIIPYQPKFVDAECLADQWDKEGKCPNKLLLAADPEQIQEVYREMTQQAWQEIDFACSADTFIEIFPRGMDKGKAVAAICSALNIRIEETAAFGDQELDIPMIEAAGAGIAMGNAIAELKKKADYVTKTNNDAGIAYALEHYLAGR